MATFQILPFDIHHAIARHLDYDSALALKRCNSYFDRSIDLNLLPAANWKDFLIRAEKQQTAEPESGDALLACFTCKRLRPRHCFGDYQRRGRHGLDHYNGRHSRYCWDCAAQHRLSPHSHSVKKGGKVHYLCWKCREWSPGRRRCGIVYPHQSLSSPLFWPEEVERDRNDYTSPFWVCHGRGEAAARSLEGLPLSVQRRIFGFLGYGDAIMLARVSSHFYTYVDPQECVVHDKFRFVRDAAMKMSRASRNGSTSLTNTDKDEPPSSAPSRACYGCFRMLPAGRFNSPSNAKQSDRPGFFWLRRCTVCLSRLGSSRFSAFHREDASHILCDKCQLMTVDGQGPCAGCVEHGPSDEVVLWDCRHQGGGEEQIDHVPTPTAIVRDDSLDTEAQTVYGSHADSLMTPSTQWRILVELLF